MQAQDHFARDSPTIFPHVCALCSFPCIDSSDDEAVGKLEQFLEWVISRLLVVFFTVSFPAPSSDVLNSYIGIRKVTAKGA